MPDLGEGGPDAHKRPETFTGRPAPLGPNPSLADLHRERQELRDSNHGQFTVEGSASVAAPLPSSAERPDRVFTVLILLVCLNAAKLCLLLWILFTILRVAAQGDAAWGSREHITAATAAIQRQVEENGDRLQMLNDRLVDFLIRGGSPAPPPR